MFEENPVKIGDDYCIVESASETEIKCRMTVNLARPAQLAPLIVFVATFEEGKCNVPGGCEFDFIEMSNVPTLAT